MTTFSWIIWKKNPRSSLAYHYVGKRTPLAGYCPVAGSVHHTPIRHPGGAGRCCCVRALIVMATLPPQTFNPSASRYCRNQSLLALVSSLDRYNFLRPAAGRRLLRSLHRQLRARFVLLGFRLSFRSHDSPTRTPRQVTRMTKRSLISVGCGFTGCIGMKSVVRNNSKWNCEDSSTRQ